MRRTFFLTLLIKSFKVRKGKIAVAILAVMMGAALVASFTTISLGIGEKVGKELRTYGANILIIPKSTDPKAYIRQEDLPKIEMSTEGHLVGYAPYTYTTVEANSKKAVLVGTWFDQIRKISPWWSIEGGWIEDRGDIKSSIVGASFAKKMNLKIGDTIRITYIGESYPLNVKGIVETGGPEDDQIFVNLVTAQRIIRRENQIDAIAVSAISSESSAEAIASEIEKAVPQTKAKIIRQVTHAEEKLLKKIQILMGLVAILVLFASAISVMSTMTTSILEREEEIGLMKAIGAKNSKVISIFLGEAVMIGIIGGVLGYFTGLILSTIIGQSVFNSSIAPKHVVFPFTIIIAVGVCLLASLLPVKRAVNIEPSITLRGE